MLDMQVAAENLPHEILSRLRRIDQGFSLNSIGLSGGPINCWLDFRVVGSTGSAYNVSIRCNHFRETAGSIKCNCPDANRSSYCKHVCWVVFKVLDHDDLDFFHPDLVDYPVVSCHLTTPLLDSEQARTHLAEKWRRPVEPQQGVKRKRGFEQPETDKFDATEECMICYEKLAVMQGCIGCLSCNKAFHSNCLHRWRQRSITCPHCREGGLLIL